MKLCTQTHILMVPVMTDFLHGFVVEPVYVKLLPN